MVNESQIICAAEYDQYTDEYDDYHLCTDDKWSSSMRPEPITSPSPPLWRWSS